MKFTTPGSYGDGVILWFGADQNIGLAQTAAAIAADAGDTDFAALYKGTSDHQAVAIDSLILSNVVANGDIQGLVNNGGNSLEWLLVDASAKDIYFGHGFNATAPLLTLLSSGNVGIGTATPGSRLPAASEVTFEVANATTTITIAITGGTDAIINMQDAGATSGQRVIDIINDNSLFQFRALNDASDVVNFQIMTFNLGSGNVGINTTVPQSLLDVQGAAGAAGILTLATKELTVIDNDKLGRIDFNAPLESDGGDAILVGAAIWAEATATFSATVNTTDLVFAVGVSEAAAEKMRLDSAGTLWVSSEADSTTAARGIAFGLSKDTNLYRSAANTLKTDDALSVGGALTVSVSGTFGTAGTGTGQLQFNGLTSGSVVLTVAAAAGVWTMTLPTGVAGVGGYQLADAAGDGVTSWTAAASRRGWKQDIADYTDHQGALRQILASPLHTFRYREGFGTGDYDTQYLGIMADESPWATHFGGNIINPVNTVGYMVAGFRAVNEIQESQEAKIIRLESRVAELEARLAA